MDAVGLAHVQTEGRLPVGDGGQQDLIACLLGRAIAADERADGFAAEIPTGERRHLPDRRIGEHVDDGVDVVAFEGRHVLGQ